MKKAHFLAFMQHGVSSHSVGMWRHPLDKIGYDYAAPPYWKHLARTLERGLFDVIPELQRRGAYKTFYTEGPCATSCLDRAHACPKPTARRATAASPRR
jgi:hypothetical protein